MCTLNQQPAAAAAVSVQTGAVSQRKTKTPQ